VQSNIAQRSVVYCSIVEYKRIHKLTQSRDAPRRALLGPSRTDVGPGDGSSVLGTWRTHTTPDHSHTRTHTHTHTAFEQEASDGKRWFVDGYKDAEEREPVVTFTLEVGGSMKRVVCSW
jgi:hypothetical protein